MYCAVAVCCMPSVIVGQWLWKYMLCKYLVVMCCASCELVLSSCHESCVIWTVTKGNFFACVVGWTSNKAAPYQPQVVWALASNSTYIAQNNKNTIKLTLNIVYEKVTCIPACYQWMEKITPYYWERNEVRLCIAVVGEKWKYYM